MTLNKDYSWFKQYEKNNIPKYIEYPDCSLYSFIANPAMTNSSRIAYEYFGSATSYRELMSSIHSAACSLKTLGVKEDDIVSICMPNTPEAIIMFYATNMIGAVANMIHPLAAEGEIKNCLTIAKSKVALVVDFNFEKFNKIKQKVKLEAIVSCSASVSMPILTSVGYWITSGRKIATIPLHDDIYDWYDFISIGKDYEGECFTPRNGDDLAVILYSGGTTGSAKGIELSNTNFNVLAIQGTSMVNVTADDTVLGILPLFHGFGLGVCTHLALYKSAKILLIPRFTPESFASLVKKKKPTFIVGVPSLYEAFINNPQLAKANLSFLKTMISGGDTLSASLKERVDEFLAMHNSRAVIREGYGLTECVAACAFSTETNKPGSVGVPMPANAIKIVEINTTKEVTTGLEGEICISGPTVMKGYRNDDKETKLVLKKHDDGNIWLHTGDIGKMDEDGFLTFVLRLKRMIITNGYNIYPSIIEKIIDSHPSVSSSTVVGIPDVKRGQKVKAFIVLKKNINPSEKIKNSIKELCEKNIAKYSLPKEYEFKTTLPRTLIGKVAYRELEKDK